MSLRVIQHNVLHWHNSKYELCNTYTSHTPDTIFLNSHGRNDNERIKIFSYNTYQRNKSGERSDSVALAIRKGLQHQIIHDFDHEFLAVKVDTNRGPIIQATGNLPPCRPFLPFSDILRLLRLRIPMYLLGDLNARHRTLGHSDNNHIGNSITRLMAEGRLDHLGPDFPILIRHNSAPSPDIVLSNRYGYLNTRITAGNLTTSDHIPVILDPSINPILIAATPRSDYKNAN